MNQWCVRVSRCVCSECLHSADGRLEWFHSILTATLWGRYCYAAHFMDEDTETQGHFVALVPLEGGTQEASREGVSRRPQGRSGENILSIKGASFAKPQNWVGAWGTCGAPCGVWLEPQDQEKVVRLRKKGWQDLVRPMCLSTDEHLLVPIMCWALY